MVISWLTAVLVADTGSTFPAQLRCGHTRKGKATGGCGTKPAHAQTGSGSACRSQNRIRHNIAACSLPSAAAMFRSRRRSRSGGFRPLRREVKQGPNRAMTFLQVMPSLTPLPVTNESAASGTALERGRAELRLPDRTRPRRRHGGAAARFAVRLARKGHARESQDSDRSARLCDFRRARGGRCRHLRGRYRARWCRHSACYNRALASEQRPRHARHARR
jgi:hypothetical protein